MNLIILSFTLLIVERLLALSLDLNIWRWVVLQTLIFSVVPFILIWRLKIKLSDVGLSIGDLQGGIKYGGIMLILAFPFMVYGAMQTAFKSYYPLWPPAGESLLYFLFFESVILLMMFNTEFMFRGLLLFGLEKGFKNVKDGRWIAIIIQATFYMIVHIGKPTLEVPYSFFVGIAFGWLALKTRSIIPSLLTHWVSSVIFDIIVLTL
jgi:membrane protease YdiL (CAAX protease family)